MPEPRVTPVDAPETRAGAFDRARAAAADEMETSFGFSRVDGHEKQGRVDGVFHSVARRYDLMNDLMSAGLHRAWKAATVAKANPRRDARRPWRGLDVAGGTGDIAFRLLEASGNTAHVTVADINASMLQVGRERAVRRGLALGGGLGDGRGVDFLEANAEVLPFEGNTFDGYTIAFGIRNVPRIERALAEAHRVLKPGGRFCCLEFSEVDVPGLEQFYEAWSFNAIPAIGRVVTGDADSYQYLIESIRKFPGPDAFANTIRAAGFERVGFERMTGGIVALHHGWKL